MSLNVLIAEDLEYLRSYVSKILQKEGYRTLEASSGEACLKILGENSIDLILLDLNLGDMDGREIIRILRRQYNDIPIMVVSNFTEIDIKVKAFDLGCDDYLTKPFYKKELLARIRRLCARTSPSSESKPAVAKLELGPFLVDYANFRVFKNGTEINMNRKLLDLFTYFVSHPEQVLTRELILDNIWKGQDFPSENSLTVHIHMLRDLIEDDPKKPEYLKTKRGAGYIFQV